MAESVDDTPTGESGIDEDSDVIELTDEVGAMTASMEKERPQSPEEATEESVSGSGTSESTPLDVEERRPQKDADDDAYDRQSMVNTSKMDAFERADVEAAATAMSPESLPVVDDARFSPEIIASPPRVLVKKWQEGLPQQVKSIVDIADKPPVDSAEDTTKPKESDDAPVSEDPEKDQSQQPAKEPKVEVDEAPVSEDAEKDRPQQPAKEPKVEVDEALVDGDGEEPEDDSDEELIELDEELVELHEEDEEPKKREPSKPPPQKPEQKPKAQKKPKSAPPKSPKENENKQQAAPETDPEMSGLVQELIEEEKQQREQKQLGPRQTWFKNVFTEEYLRSIPSNISEITKKEADFIEKSLRLKKKSRILDLACGFGRHSIELAQRDYEMVGLDLSRPLLQHALDAAQKQSLNVKFIHGDMRDLSFSGIFDGCFVWDTSLGYFDDRTNLGVLHGLYRALKVGGRLLIDVINRDHVIQQTPTRLWWEGNGCIFLEETEFDYQTSTLESQRSYIYEDGTPPVEHTSYIRLYNVHELRQMLHVAGFKVLEVSGERHHKGHFLGEASRRIILLAEKKKKKKKRSRPGNQRRASSTGSKSNG